MLVCEVRYGGLGREFRIFREFGIDGGQYLAALVHIVDFRCGHGHFVGITVAELGVVVLYVAEAFRLEVYILSKSFWTFWNSWLWSSKAARLSAALSTASTTVASRSVPEDAIVSSVRLREISVL